MAMLQVGITVSAVAAMWLWSHRLVQVDVLQHIDMSQSAFLCVTGVTAPAGHSATRQARLAAEAAAQGWHACLKGWAAGLMVHTFHTIAGDLPPYIQGSNAPSVR